VSWGRLLVLVAVPVGAVLMVPGSSASFSGLNGNPGNTYAFTALYHPTGLTATASGHDVQLGWSAGQNGSGYGVRGVTNGTSSDCSSASFASVGSTASTGYTDTGRYTPQGTWFCYQVQTTYASWTSVQSNPVAAAQIGVVATSLSATNGGIAARLDAGDTITVNFNQPITTSSGPSGTNSVCSVSGSTILLGSTTAGNTACATGETANLGKLTGGSATANGRWSATYTWTNNNTKLTVVLGARTTGNNPTVTGTWTFNPTTTATKVLSATGSFHICDTNAGGGNCLPTMTGGF
jgi:hypothetical protein